MYKRLITGSWASQHNDLGLLVLRAVTGLIFLVHGWMKLQGGTEGVTTMLTQLGFPLPGIFAIILIAAEVVGGAALILGAYTRLAATFTSVVALVAFLLVHLENGFMVGRGGYEFIILLLAASVAILILGAGALSLDRKVIKI